MIASLPMYDRPALRAANNRFWSALDLGLERTNPDDLWAHWHDPTLLFSQTCGLPYALGLHKHLTLLGAPDFGLPDCPPGHYNSVLLTRGDDTRSAIAAFSDAPVAFNQSHSQSGWGAFYAYAAARGVTFSNLIGTGGHTASVQALLEGRVDLACIDAHTFRLICRDTPEAKTLRMLDRTPPTPGTPYVTALPDRADDLRAKLRAAIVGLSDEDRATLCLHGLVDISHKAYLALPIPPDP
ncbi:phosphate/phosphite/phosphonate ABC transporter substrate-binding protein [Cognatishimia sp. MH4019]|uniref:phosphate/phosphite/phosphonate ABC transporter substrate-binding protein n=1 Tax=Cognatishimia sp. MH4019 TaxID=2854030 RepID=UPI001CD1B2ED|nr:PhnD/SsuA/transferrin family substrate-binding protein [Cognatishimia sp. MH4019]